MQFVVPFIIMAFAYTSVSGSNWVTVVFYLRIVTVHEQKSRSITHHYINSCHCLSWLNQGSKQSVTKNSQAFVFFEPKTKTKRNVQKNYLNSLWSIKRCRWIYCAKNAFSASLYLFYSFYLVSFFSLSLFCTYFSWEYLRQNQPQNKISIQ